MKLWTVLSLLTGQALAAPPPGTTPDPALKAWFESLRQPGSSQSCCSIADCRFTSVTTHQGRTEVEIYDQRLTVPEDRVIRDAVSPDGRAVVCYAYTEFLPPPPPGVAATGPQDKIEILCFVPARPVS